MSSFRVEIVVGGERVAAEMELPAGPTRPERILPVLQEITDRIVDNAVESAAKEGLHVACKARCDACCRQLVPIAPTEARRIREIVLEMPEPRRSTLLARFASALDSVRAAGLYEALRDSADASEEQVEQLSLAYFRLGNACPFLEDGLCSIRSDRPLACREFLVSSPAEHCKNPTPGTIRRIELQGALNPSDALERIDLQPNDPEPRNTWLPLIRLLEWAEANPDAGPPRAAPEIFQSFMHLIARGEAMKPPAKKGFKPKEKRRRR